MEQRCQRVIYSRSYTNSLISRANALHWACDGNDIYYFLRQPTSNKQNKNLYLADLALI
jgi:nitrous oxide reductase accessory protein NosL